MIIVVKNHDSTHSALTPTDLTTELLHSDFKIGVMVDVSEPVQHLFFIHNEKLCCAQLQTNSAKIFPQITQLINNARVTEQRRWEQTEQEKAAIQTYLTQDALRFSAEEMHAIREKYKKNSFVAEQQVNYPVNKSSLLSSVQQSLLYQGVINIASGNCAFNYYLQTISEQVETREKLCAILSAIILKKPLPEALKAKLTAADYIIIQNFRHAFLAPNNIVAFHENLYCDASHKPSVGDVYDYYIYCLQAILMAENCCIPDAEIASLSPAARSVQVGNHAYDFGGEGIYNSFGLSENEDKIMRYVRAHIEQQADVFDDADSMNGSIADDFLDEDRPENILLNAEFSHPDFQKILYPFLDELVNAYDSKKTPNLAEYTEALIYLNGIYSGTFSESVNNRSNEFRETIFERLRDSRNLVENNLDRNWVLSSYEGQDLSSYHQGLVRNSKKPVWAIKIIKTLENYPLLLSAEGLAFLCHQKTYNKAILMSRAFWMLFDGGLIQRTSDFVKYPDADHIARGLIALMNTDSLYMAENIAILFIPRSSVIIHLLADALEHLQREGMLTQAIFNRVCCVDHIDHAAGEVFRLQKPSLLRAILLLREANILRQYFDRISDHSNPTAVANGLSVLHAEEGMEHSENIDILFAYQGMPYDRCDFFEDDDEEANEPHETHLGDCLAILKKNDIRLTQGYFDVLAHQASLELLQGLTVLDRCENLTQETFMLALQRHKLDQRGLGYSVESISAEQPRSLPLQHLFGQMQSFRLEDARSQASSPSL